jgi:UDP-glucose 4-epimerase
VRPFNIIGPRQTSAYGMVVPTFVRAALKGEYLPIHGDGKQSRTFSDVRLAVKLLWSLIKNQDSYNQIFNLATTTQEISIIELALMVCRLAKVNAKYNFIPYEIDFDKNFIDIKMRSPHLDKLKAYTEKWNYTNLEDTLLDIIESERQKLSVKKTHCLQEGYKANKV